MNKQIEKLDEKHEIGYIGLTIKAHSEIVCAVEFSLEKERVDALLNSFCEELVNQLK